MVRTCRRGRERRGHHVQTDRAGDQAAEMRRPMGRRVIDLQMKREHASAAGIRVIGRRQIHAAQGI